MTPKLTVNLGVRYDYATWPYEGADRMTNLDPITGQKFTPANSDFGRSLVQSDKNNFAPRIGLAYQVNSNTVVRAGYGRFNMTFERAGSEDQPRSICLGSSTTWSRVQIPIRRQQYEAGVGLQPVA